LLQAINNTLISFFTSRIRKSTKEKSEDFIDDQQLSQQFDMLVFGEEEERLELHLGK
jgi:hypothetical protein